MRSALSAVAAGAALSCTIQEARADEWTEPRYIIQVYAINDGTNLQLSGAPINGCTWVFIDANDGNAEAKVGAALTAFAQGDMVGVYINPSAGCPIPTYHIAVVPAPSGSSMMSSGGEGGGESLASSSGVASSAGGSPQYPPPLQ